MSRYLDFLAGKKRETAAAGVAHGSIHPALFPFQRETVEFLLSKGRAAAFLDTGLGKTIVQCEWARHIPGEVLIVAPLAVAQQTVAEARKHLGMDIGFSRDGSVAGQWTITNYERLERFDCGRFTGVVLDESSILKGFMSKTKQFLCEAFNCTPCRLACTATPAPNDFMEIGNHSQFLGVMESTEMLTRWFINDQSSTGTYRLKGHAVRPFWEWVGSWAACVSMPSDLGFPDDGYVLPPLEMETRIVTAPLQQGADDELFALPVLWTANTHPVELLQSGQLSKERAGAIIGRLMEASQIVKA